MDNQDYIWQTAFADIKRTQDNLDYVEKLMKDDYDIEEYLIGSETEPRHHFHLVAKTTKKTFTNLLKKIATDYKLFTTTRGGQRKYGIDKKKVMTLEQCLIYCTKQSEGDTSNLRASYEETELQAFFEKSYIVKKKDDLKKTVLEHMDKEYPTEIEAWHSTSVFPNKLHYYKNIIENIKLIIINYLRTKHNIYNISRGSLNMYTQFYFNLSEHISEDARDYLIYYLIN